MSITIYRDAVRIDMQSQKDAANIFLRRADFRIPKVPRGQEQAFFQPDSFLRQKLKVNVDSSVPARLSLRERWRLRHAPEKSIVGECDDLLEGAKVLSDLHRRRVNMEFLAVKIREKDKIVLMKGGIVQRKVLDVQLRDQSVCCPPGIPEGPCIHTHPAGLNFLPSFGDYRSMIMAGLPFSIVLGYKGDDSRVTKFYALGPLRVNEFQWGSLKSTYPMVIQALIGDDNILCDVHYSKGHDSITGMLKHGDGNDKFFEVYQEDFVKFGTEIEKLEGILHPDPSVNFEQAIRLANLHILTKHFLHAIILLEKLGERQSQEEQARINDLKEAAIRSIPELTLRFI